MSRHNFAEWYGGDYDDNNPTDAIEGKFAEHIGGDGTSKEEILADIERLFKLKKPLMFRIWCAERGSYWKQDSYGYTFKLNEAGQFTAEEASKICHTANVVRVNELMVPVVS